MAFEKGKLYQTTQPFVLVPYSKESCVDLWDLVSNDEFSPSGSILMFIGTEMIQEIELITHKKGSAYVKAQVFLHKSEKVMIFNKNLEDEKARYNKEPLVPIL